MPLTRRFIPSLFTVLNAFCGFMSLVHSSNGDFTNAAMFIIYASLFDAVDGIAARLTNSASRFGVELDSLSDVISFGAAPSFLIYNIYLKELGDIGMVISSFILIFAALRLARFNVQLTGFDKEKFSGLPAPMSAFTICTYVLFYHDKILPRDTSIAVLMVLAIMLPVLMVSRIKYDTLPKPSAASIRKNIIPFAVLLIAVILIIVTEGEGSFSFCLFYIFSGIFRSLKNMIFRRKHKHHHDDDIINETLETGK
jgi:CDP-diacylglycerol--serine O-phosphatidyltransferase